MLFAFQPLLDVLCQQIVQAAVLLVDIHQTVQVGGGELIQLHAGGDVVLFEIRFEGAIEMFEVDGDCLEYHGELQVVPFIVVHVIVHVGLEQLTLSHKGCVVHFDPLVHHQQVLHEGLGDVSYLLHLPAETLEGLLGEQGTGDGTF